VFNETVGIVNTTVMRTHLYKHLELAFVGNAVLVVIAFMVGSDAVGNLLGFASGGATVYRSWKFGTLTGMTAVGAEIGIVLLNLVVAAYAVRGLVLWRRKHA